MSSLPHFRTAQVLCLAIFSLLVLGGAFASADYDPTEEIVTIQEQIDANGYHWIATETDMNRIAPEDRMVNFGRLLKPGETGMLDLDTHFSGEPNRDLPSSWDWRVNGGTTAVTQQGGCGSCWDFAATAAFESVIKIYTGRTENISEQAVLSCNYAGQGCSGGWAETAYDLFIFPGAVAESCMPYAANDQVPCTMYDCDIIDVIDGYADIYPNTVENIKTAVFDHPVAVAVTAFDDWNSYGGGCYDNSDYAPVNHQVLIVGWDDNMCDGEGAWIIKNSWGGGWGVSGYMYIKYGCCNIGYAAQEIFYTGIGDTHIWHQPLVDTEELINDYQVEIEVATRDFPVDQSTVYLHYDTGTGEMQMLMTPNRDGEDVTFTAQIPCQELGTEIKYWLSASDTNGTTDVDPSDAPVSKHSFNVLRYMTNDPCEVIGDWTVGDIDDTATAGIWGWSMPEGTWGEDDVPCNPDRDHTPDLNFYAWTTGPAAGGMYWDNDVDNGKTTLFSPIYDLEGIFSATVNYYRWYINNGQNYPEEDYWQVDVTSNGIDWVNLEYDNQSNSYWKFIEFQLDEFIDLTSTVQFRFIASDYINPSIVEGGLDDFVIYTFEEGISATPGDDQFSQAIRLTPDASLFSNQATLRYELPRATTGSLQIFGVDGRNVRTLVEGELQPGSHVVSWDGLDSGGRQVPAGLYLIRLATPEMKVENRIMRVR
jgi:C1A family cysteine protease